MDVKNFTYNDIAFMAFGEAISAKHQIDAMVAENAKLTDMVFDLSIELAELKGEPSPYDGT